MTGADRLTVELVRTPERLAAVGPAWMALWRSSGGAVFQSHAWIEAWWRTLPEAGRPRLAVALGWRGDELAAVLPMVIQRRRGLRALEWAAKDHSDYCDGLALAGPDRGAMLRRLWTGVVAAGGFDLAYLSHLQPDAAAFPVMAGAGPAGFHLRANHRRAVSLRVRSSWPTGRDWFESLPKKGRQNYRRGRKMLGEFGRAEFRRIGPAEPLGPVLDRIAELKRDWLVRSGNRSTLVEDGARPFRALVQVLADLGLLRIYVLECDGAIAAAAVNFVERGRMMAFVAAYDHAYERASLGTVLMTDYMMAAFDEGVSEIDFLCGAEDYKLKFATARVEIVSLAGGRTLPGRLAVGLDALSPTLAALRLRLAGATGRLRPGGASEIPVESQPRRA